MPSDTRDLQKSRGGKKWSFPDEKQIQYPSPLPISLFDLLTVFHPLLALTPGKTRIKVDACESIPDFFWKYSHRVPSFALGKRNWEKNCHETWRKGRRRKRRSWYSLEIVVGETNDKELSWISEGMRLSSCVSKNKVRSMILRYRWIRSYSGENDIKFLSSFSCSFSHFLTHLVARSSLAPRPLVRLNRGIFSVLRGYTILCFSGYPW